MTSKYPKHLYDAQGRPVEVNSEKEETELQGTYYESPADIPKSGDEPDQPEAPPAPAPRVEDTRSVINEEPLKPGHEHRDRLVAEAERLGLKVDKRWSNERLQREIFEFSSS